MDENVGHILGALLFVHALPPLWLSLQLSASKVLTTLSLYLGSRELWQK